MDGNRRWARAAGFADPSAGHQRGADHVEELLGWCADWGIEHVTTYVLSADNIRKRSSTEVGYLFELLTGTIPDLVTRNERWSLHLSGDLTLLPPETREALRTAESATAGRPWHLTMAVGYDGHWDILEGVRGAVLAGADEVDVDAITAHLPGGPVKEIDLVIRTSGELRLSGFFPWQTTRAEIFVSPKLWPDFGAADFAEAVRFYSDRAADR